MVLKTTSLTADERASIQLLDRQLCFALYSASLTVTKIYKPLLAKFGLTYPQYLVMLALWETDSIGVSALGERLYLDSGTLTPLLKRMQALGYLTRERDAADERRVIVTLTAEGRQLKKAAVVVPVGLVNAAGCSLGDLGDLTERLQALRGSLAAELGSSETPSLV
ncbi:MAG: MarR family transcriptional regulator [Rhizobacter sp.]|nr:MarR family transcriptional regulator [Rhizobacter sp.]